MNREILLQSLEDFMQETDARLTALEAKPQMPESAVDWKAFAARATAENERLTAEIDLDVLATEECCTLWAALVTPYAATETGKAALGKLVRKYGLGEICDCMRISVRLYLERTRDGEIVRESVHKAFDYIGRIARNRKRIQERPYLEAAKPQAQPGWFDVAKQYAAEVDDLRNVNAGLRKENARLTAERDAAKREVAELLQSNANLSDKLYG